MDERAGEFKGLNRYDYRCYVDCREFHWPRGPYKHSGEHVKALESVVNHKGFRNWLALVKQRVKDEMQDAETESLSMVMVCKRGRNRSVSCSRILHYIFNKLGFNSPSVVHISKSAWKDLGVCLGACTACQVHDMQNDNKMILEEAFEAWTRV